MNVNPDREEEYGWNRLKEDASPYFDIIIVNYNSTDCLIKCLGSIHAILGNMTATISVQDNASCDDVDRILKYFPKTCLTKNKTNLGFASAVNQALKKSTAPYVVLLNPDSFIVEGFFDSVLNYLKAHPEIGIIGPKILDSDGKVQGSARSFPTPLTAFFGRKSLFTRLFPNNPITTSNVLTTRSDGVTPMEVDWVSGACMVVNKKAIEQVGLLDERFFIYWEDADWCRRMWDTGWKIVYFPRSCVVHYVGVSSDQLLIRSQYEFHKSVYMLFEKYNRPSSWVTKAFIAFGLFFRLCFVVLSSGVTLWIRRHKVKPEFLLTTGEAPIKQIKVLRMIARLNIGGPAIHVSLLSKGLNKEKFDSTLVTGIISPQEGDMSYLLESQGIRTIVIPELQREISFKMDLKTIAKIFRSLIKENPDIVHTHTAKAGTSARLAALAYNAIKGKKLRVVHTFHGHIFEGYFSKAKSMFFVWIERLLGRMSDAIVAISPTQKKDLAEKYRIAPADKIKTIELGFDLEPFLKSAGLKGRFRKSRGIGNEAIVIGIIGRLVPIKNHDMFLKAAKRVIEQRPERYIKFVIVGDGELRQELESKCKNYGLTDHVEFCGWVRDVAMVYADLDILALTSINEGTPVSIIEAMASSVPVIATDVGGVRDLLGIPYHLVDSTGFMPCERGILCRNKDFAGFAKGLSHLIDLKSKDGEDQVIRARAFVCERFDQDRLLQDVEALYDEVMAF
jgi:GT2 family glycosyltransferase